MVAVGNAAWVPSVVKVRVTVSPVFASAGLALFDAMCTALTSGAVVSMVTARVLDGPLVRPARSEAVAVKLWVASGWVPSARVPVVSVH